MAAHHCYGTGAQSRRDWLSKEARAELEGVVRAIACTAVRKAAGCL